MSITAIFASSLSSARSISWKFKSSTDTDDEHIIANLKSIKEEAVDPDSSRKVALLVLNKILNGGHPLLPKSNLRKTAANYLTEEYGIIKNPTRVVSQAIATGRTTFDDGRITTLNRICEAIGIESWEYLIGRVPFISQGTLKLRINKPQSSNESKAAEKATGNNVEAKLAKIQEGKRTISVQWESHKGATLNSKAAFILGEIFKHYQTSAHQLIHALDIAQVVSLNKLVALRSQQSDLTPIKRENRDYV